MKFSFLSVFVLAFLGYIANGLNDLILKSNRIETLENMSEFLSSNKEKSCL